MGRLEDRADRPGFGSYPADQIGRRAGTGVGMRLADIRCGETARVIGVSGEGHLRKRILDLGFTRGAVVRLIRIAPLGDPVEVELRGYRLTVRKSEAAGIELEPLSDSDSEAEEPVAAESDISEDRGGSE